LLTAQNDAISSHILQLHSLEHTVQDGNALILDRLAVSEIQEKIQDVVLSSSRAFEVRKPKTQKRHKIRIALPRFFTDRVWEFGLQESENGWAMQLHPVIERPLDSFVFNVVRSGSVPAVRRLLESGDLSMQDHAAASEYWPRRSLLDVRSQRLSIHGGYLF
jgi:hypothetical protein